MKRLILLSLFVIVGVSSGCNSGRYQAVGVQRNGKDPYFMILDTQTGAWQCTEGGQSGYFQK